MKCGNMSHNGGISISSFYGEFKFNRDSKGRIQLPAEFRELMSFGDNPRMLVMTKGPDDCIYVFMPKDFEKYTAKFSEMQIGKKDKNRLKRIMASSTVNCKIDGQWRMKLPEKLVRHAAIEKEVKIVGLLDKIELWNPTRYEAYIKSGDFDYDTFSTDLFND